MVKFLGKIYYYIWHDFLCRLEPFTFQFRRMAKAHPIFFWGTIGTIMVGTLGGGIWFILHIIGVI